MDIQSEMLSLRSEIEELRHFKTEFTRRMTGVIKSQSKLNQMLGEHMVFVSDIDMYMNAVSIATGIKPDSIRSNTRQREIVEARQIFCWLLRTNTDMSFNEIGQYASHRKMNHATVLYSVKMVENAIEIAERGVKSRIAHTVKKVNSILAIQQTKQ